MNLSAHEEELPIPITNAYVGGHGHNSIHKAPQAPPPPPLPSAKEEADDDNNNNNHHHHHHHYHHQSTPQKGVMVVKYRECLKNHAAAIGGNATDGCGEFMPSGEEGTLEALKCSACSCHRNFHRKEAEGESPYDCFHALRGRKAAGTFGYSTAGHGLILPRAAPHNMIMALQTSESDEMMGRPLTVKKRFRTKFTTEQKEKMLSFAERVGWRLQRQEEGVVQQFCQEIGVKRRVLKVWMHNNKHNLAKKTPLLLE